MQIGSTSGSAESLATIQGSSSNRSEQNQRQVQSNEQEVLQETTQRPTGNVGQNINTTA
ncbi:MAG: hypothetical protein GJ680_01985 [Alteromonadaceae bacterium]|nr:hypothetical protein [Alteromonadaceae bacterium]